MEEVARPSGLRVGDPVCRVGHPDIHGVVTQVNVMKYQLVEVEWDDGDKDLYYQTDVVLLENKDEQERTPLQKSLD